MKRMKLYDVPHKGLRNALSQLSLLAGKTDYSSIQEVKNLYNLGTDVFKIISIHAEEENEILLAELEERCPGATENDIEDHEELHAFQYNLEQLLRRIHSAALEGIDVSEEGAEFYLTLSEFQGQYLEHTAEEERITQILLWEYFTDEELAAFRGKIMAKNSPETLLIWFRFVLPAQSHNERVELLSGLKQMAPADFFQQGMETIKNSLSTEEFERLEEDLNLIAAA